MSDPAHVLILTIVFYRSLEWLDSLKAAPTPLPYGIARRWESFLITPEAIDRLYGESIPAAWGYAAVMEEMREVFDAVPKAVFVPKKGRA